MDIGVFLFLLVRVPSAHVPCGEMRGRKSGLSALIICVHVLSLVRQFYEGSAVVFFVFVMLRHGRKKKHPEIYI